MANKRGRKNKYQTHVEPYLKDIEHWCRDGRTEDEIRRRLGVAMSTFSTYKNQYPELSEVLKRGKAEADYEVEDALFKRAIGYEFEEITSERVYNERTEEWVLEETKRVLKKQAPDTTAAIFWLKNRKPQVWRDKQDVEHSGGMNNSVDLSGLSVEELRKLANTDE